MKYPAKFQHEGDGMFSVSFRDIPEALTQGQGLEEAKERAQDALITAMDFYFEDRRLLPMPSAAKDGEELIELPSSIAIKVFLLNQMILDSVTPAELARRLHTSPQNVNRIMKLEHTTKLDTIAEAFKALGKSLDFSIA